MRRAKAFTCSSVVPSGCSSVVRTCRLSYPGQLLPGRLGAKMELKSARTLVTGGTSFIGSHLVEQLVGRVGSLRVIDNLSSGRVGYLEPLISDGVEFIEGD